MLGGFCMETVLFVVYRVLLEQLIPEHGLHLGNKSIRMRDRPNSSSGAKIESHLSSKLSQQVGWLYWPFLPDQLCHRPRENRIQQVDYRYWRYIWRLEGDFDPVLRLIREYLSKDRYLWLTRWFHSQSCSSKVSQSSNWSLFFPCRLHSCFFLPDLFISKLSESRNELHLVHQDWFIKLASILID